MSTPEFSFVRPPSSDGGGSPISTPGVAYVQTNGDDGTAEVGNPAKPFLTAQAAFDAGAVSFHIGVGVTTSITHTYVTASASIRSDNLKFTGEGSQTSKITLTFNVSGVPGSARFLDICSDHSVTFNSINATLTAGSNIQVNGRCLTVTTYNLPEGNYGMLFSCIVQNDDPGWNARRSANYCQINGANWLNPYDP